MSSAACGPAFELKKQAQASALFAKLFNQRPVTARHSGWRGERDSDSSSEPEASNIGEFNSDWGDRDENS